MITFVIPSHPSKVHWLSGIDLAGIVLEEKSRIPSWDFGITLYVKEKEIGNGVCVCAGGGGGVGGYIKKKLRRGQKRPGKN